MATGRVFKDSQTVHADLSCGCLPTGPLEIPELGGFTPDERTELIDSAILVGRNFGHIVWDLNQTRGPLNQSAACSQCPATYLYIRGMSWSRAGDTPSRATLFNRHTSTYLRGRWYGTELHSGPDRLAPGFVVGVDTKLERTLRAQPRPVVLWSISQIGRTVAVTRPVVLRHYSPGDGDALATALKPNPGPIGTLLRTLNLHQPELTMTELLATAADALR